MATQLQKLIENAGVGVAETIKLVNAAGSQALKEGRAKEFKEISEARKTLEFIFASLGNAYKKAGRPTRILDAQEEGHGQENR